MERSSEELQAERRDLAVEFLFCLALIEVLKQLPFHPGHEDLVQYIENVAFKRFNYKDGLVAIRIKRYISMSFESSVIS